MFVNIIVRILSFTNFYKTKYNKNVYLTLKYNYIVHIIKWVFKVCKLAVEVCNIIIILYSSTLLGKKKCFKTFVIKSLNC